jgi:hypothetical protein
MGVRQPASRRDHIIRNVSSIVSLVVSLVMSSVVSLIAA